MDPTPSMVSSVCLSKFFILNLRFSLIANLCASSLIFCNVKRASEFLFNKIESFLKDYDFIIRCHKSYIVNTKYVNKVTGNARGYLLKCNILDFYIPVSRKFSKKSLLTLVK